MWQVHFLDFFKSMCYKDKQDLHKLQTIHTLFKALHSPHFHSYMFNERWNEEEFIKTFANAL